MPPTAPSYDIGRPTGQCAETGRAFEPGERFVATLTEAPPEDNATAGPTLRRQDFSTDAWEQGHRPPSLFAFWHATMREPSTDDTPFDTSDLMQLFDSLVTNEDDEPNQNRAAFRYILALVLIRSRLLIQRGARGPADDQPAALLVTRKGEPPDTAPEAVTEPSLDPATLAHLTEQLRRVMNA